MSTELVFSFVGCLATLFAGVVPMAIAISKKEDQRQQLLDQLMKEIDKRTAVSLKLRELEQRVAKMPSQVKCCDQVKCIAEHIVKIMHDESTMKLPGSIKDQLPIEQNLQYHPPGT